MAERIPQSVSYLVVFRAYLASDGKTPATGKSIAITISKNGATSFSNPAAGATNATEMASGFYKFTLGVGDVDTVGPLAWRGAHADINDAGDVLSVTTGVIVAPNGINRAAFAADTGLQSIRSSTAQAGAASTITLDAGASAVDDFYNGASILLTGGTGAGQYNIITDYVGSTKVATVESAWVTNPDNTTTFAIFPAAASPTDIAAAVRTNLTTELGRIDAAVSSRLATAGYTVPLDAAGVRTAVGLASANLDTQIGDLPTNAELATSQAAADDATLAAIAALSVPSAAAVAAAVLAAAEAAPIESNIKAVNDVTIQGAGVSGNSWRPA